MPQAGTPCRPRSLLKVARSLPLQLPVPPKAALGARAPVERQLCRGSYIACATVTEVRGHFYIAALTPAKPCRDGPPMR